MTESVDRSIERSDERLSPDELSTLFLFESLDAERLDWLAGLGWVETLPAGSEVTVEGEPASRFFVLLDGTLAMFRRVRDGEIEVNRSSQRGAYTGAIRAWLEPEGNVTYRGTVRAVTDCRFFVLPGREFGAAVREWFPMATHLMQGIAQGAQSSQQLVNQRERLLSLGQLTAGLTHELNNPAAAAVRATSTLRERVAAMRGKLGHLAGGKVDPDTLVTLMGVQEEAIERAAKAPDRSPLEISDAEDELTDWLDDHGVTAGWQIAPVLVNAGLDREWLEGALAAIPATHREAGLRWITYTLETEQLMHEIEDSTARISDLLAAAKQYSQMDRADHQVIDVHEGLKSTLTMFRSKIPEGVTVVKEFDRTLPRISAYPGELNQVWTNLIDNALGAMAGEGTLTIRTARDGDCALIEVCDTGPGVPPELVERIFEPFFTTKPVGQGTGLGLDISWRIVAKRHGGDLRVVSEPGDTRFQVRLPLT